MDRIGDEIGKLAVKYLAEDDFSSLSEIDERILCAQADCDWDRMSKWHRVRFRYLRMLRERGAPDAFVVIQPG